MKNILYCIVLYCIVLYCINKKNGEIQWCTGGVYSLRVPQEDGEELTFKRSLSLSGVRETCTYTPAEKPGTEEVKPGTSTMSSLV